ncbi:MAG: response regulator [Opitutaceae bacterium]|nr:response regulator [Opitutaceae bacterium]
MSRSAPEPARAHILVVEDSSVFREMQSLLLGTAGFIVSAHESPQAALAVAAKQRFDLVVIDYELPEMNGQQFMHALRAIQPEIAVVFVSGALTLDLAIQLSSQGVAGIFNKPANPKTLLEKINETLFRHAARDTAVRGASASPLPDARRGNAAPGYVPPVPAADQCAYAPQFVVGSSDTFREFTHRVWKVRDFRAVLLLQGEAGSPFEFFAQELAGISMFREGPVMFCPAAEFEPRRLIEILAPSLLSHDAGTLIVSGVETFTAQQQTTLENLISGRDVFLTFARRFRTVLAATNELSSRVDAGTFNETLFYKISSISLTVPNLRDMKGDVPANALHILERIRAETNATTPWTLTPEAVAMLEAEPFNGNYAELEQRLRNAAANQPGGALDVAALRGRGAHRRVPESDTIAPFVSPAGSSAKSFFRPASASYQFAERLAETLELAGTMHAA